MKKRIFSLLLCLMMLFAFSASAQEVRPNVTDLMFTYTDLDLNPYKGKTVLLNFFTEWCYYCMKEMPDLKAVHDLYDEDKFEVVLVHVWDGEDETNTHNVQEKYGMQDMVFFEDTDRMVANVAGLRGYPATIIAEPDGTLAFAVNSMVTLDALTEVLDGMGVPRAQEAADESV